MLRLAADVCNMGPARNKIGLVIGSTNQECLSVLIFKVLRTKNLGKIFHKMFYECDAIILYRYSSANVY